MAKDDLFGFIDSMFNKDYDEQSNHTKNKHFFIINRFMSINWPIQAAYLNRYKINQVAVVDFWKRTLNKISNQPPAWMYTKTKKNTDTKKGKEYIPSKEAVELYCKTYECTSKEINELKKRFPSELNEELQKFDSLISYKIDKVKNE